MRNKNKARGFAGGSKRVANKKAVRTLDMLAEYEEYKEKVAKWIRKDLNAGLSAKDIRDKYHAMVQARITSLALLDPDPGKAIMAAKDHIDRVEGRATEHKETTHRFENVPDQELNSILQSSVADLLELEDNGKTH